MKKIVTKGWIARNKSGSLYYWRNLEKSPERVYIGAGDDIQEEPNTWSPFYGRETLPTKEFPELRWESDPIKVITTIENEN